jgi:anaerobic magnesium-protoporphyrin IX monomethyl ester cyclase
MNILFIYPNIVESPKDISTGIGMLSAIAKQKGHKTKLIDSSFGVKDSLIVKEAVSFKPDLIAFSTATNDFGYACRIATFLKKRFDVPFIAGGFHPTIAPEEVISKKCFDMICVGEGDFTFSELLEKMEGKKSLTKIKNIWIKKNGKIIKNPVRKLAENLDSLPFPDRDIFDYEKYLKWNHGTATFISTRGCPFQCSYCINHFLAKKYKGKGKYVRFRGVDNFLE